METLTSCIQREPLIKLQDGGSASVLNYNLPQSTTYEVISLLKLDIKKSAFKKSVTSVPSNDFWDQLRTTKPDDDQMRSILGGKEYVAIDAIQNVAIHLNSKSNITNSGIVLKVANIPLSTSTFAFSSDYIGNRIKEGYYPFLFKRLSGKQGLRFIKEPKATKPAIYIVMKMRMASYLGDYGAGPTLKTFSLLPGEKTTISVRNYEQDIETSSEAQSVLDSYSESTTDDLQTTIDTNIEQDYSWSETDTDTLAASVSYDVGGGVDLGIVQLGAEAGVDASGSTVNTTNEAISQQIGVLTSSVDHHVQTADTKRQIEINTEVTSTATSETEETISRTLENINKSRVLNFVFRQLLQEYFTITYVYDVSFYFTNGFPSSKKTATLSTLTGLLQEVLDEDADVKSVRQKIYEHLCNISDYTGTNVGLIESVTQESKNCIHPKASDTSSHYVRVKRGLSQTYRDKTVPGIILNVSSRILRTSSLVVDALLGQGEALDCYNMQLQDAAATSAHLTNTVTQQMVAVIDGITDPVEKAKLYKKVFGDCCDVPQSCCCGGSSTSDS